MSDNAPSSRPTTDERVTTTIRLTERMRDALKIESIRRGMSLSAILEEGARLWAEANDVELPL